MKEAKYQKIANLIKQSILNNEYKIGDMLPFENQLQDNFKVSRHTVREAINVLVNEGYVQKKKGVGTFVIDEYTKSNSMDNKNIGVIVTYMSDYIFPNIIRGIEQVLKEKGYSLILSSTNNNPVEERQTLELMIQQNVSGIIIEPTKSNQFNVNLSCYSLLKKKKIPFLFINAKYQEMDEPSVCVDDVQSGFLATNHLIENGHENIVIITKEDDIQGKFRMKGYIKALELNKMIINDENIILYNTENQNEKIMHLTSKIINKEIGCTSIVTYNDQIAYIIMNELKKNNIKVPEDISIVGEDNSSLSRLENVSLTTTNHPQEELGQIAAHNLIRLINNVLPDNEKETILKTHLIKRSTVKSI
ncbi:GntR family transcriptional regulator [Macrococcoides goetzii]|uniref:GntR family transcriptional regulator n=1 Tax=Macrococcoides goetzii TaxID=1891097 RepID=A0A395GAI6_9STAP|nr:GntR family transcriptional regulator [Macrococcus goetzii]RAI80663.1 GntR family transcriptional regulator [Macrococcus goetzii]